MASTITIRRQIRSIGNTRKVTKAMELVSAAKMRRAVAAVLATRDYAHAAGSILARIAKSGHGEVLHPLLETRKEIKTVAVLAIGSNRGLCGGFNTQLGMAINRTLSKSGAQVRVISLGRKIRDVLARNGYEVEADFIKQDITRSVLDIQGVTQMLIEEYVKGEYDQVLLAYTDFVSVMQQVPTVAPLIPFVSNAESVKEENPQATAEYLYEPDAQTVLAEILPRLIEMEIFQAVLESEASEHSARMMAMKNATNAAKDMLDDLRLTYNQARQASITQEIAEISAGRLALE